MCVDGRQIYTHATHAGAGVSERRANTRTKSFYYSLNSINTLLMHYTHGFLLQIVLLKSKVPIPVWSANNNKNVHFMKWILSKTAFDLLFQCKIQQLHESKAPIFMFCEKWRNFCCNIRMCNVFTSKYLHVCRFLSVS